jgi:hypothetical protein
MIKFTTTSGSIKVTDRRLVVLSWYSEFLNETTTTKKDNCNDKTDKKLTMPFNIYNGNHNVSLIFNACAA